MTAPQPTMREEVGMDDLEDLAAPGIDSSLPSDLQGKTQSELAALVQSTREAVKISEDARKNAETVAWAAREAGISRPTQVEAPRQEQVSPLEQVTDEQLEEMFQNGKGLDAVKIVEARAAQRIERSLNARFGGVAQSQARSAEMESQRKHAEAFTLFGPEISKIASSIPASGLTSSENWDVIVASVVGRPENIDKLWAHRSERAARESARSETGFIASRPASAPRVAAMQDSSDLDETEKKIALNTFPARTPEESYSEYKKWR